MKYTSPIGRIVQGNGLVGNPQFVGDTQTPKLGKAGTQLVNWYVTVAFDKANPKTGEMVAAIQTEAARLFPALFPYGYQPAARADVQPPINAGGCIRNDFAYKLIDGDGYDANGKAHSGKEGWKGCWILKISTYAGAMRIVNGLNNNAPITEVGNESGKIKTGDFVICCLDIGSNGWTGKADSKPGVFMNPDLLQLVGYGDAIVSGPNPDEMLKGAAAAAGGYVPAGMSTTPPVAALPGASVPSLPAPLAPAGSAGALPSIPAPAALVPAAPQYVISPEAAAAGHTKESLNAAGHTDDSLLANGYLVPAQAPAAAPALSGLAASPALPVIPTPSAIAAPALPVIPNHGVVAAVLATPQYAVTPAVAAQGHTLESLQAAGHTIDALLAAQYITRV